ncbi:hypothetical protein Dimus_009174 [Dionaea muscipula]
MSGGFFRGTSAEQDTRFSNKQAKLMKSHKFPPELEHLVDMRKVEMEIIKPWIAKRVTELLGFEDEVLINFIYGLLEAKEVNGKEVQIQLTGFMEKHTGRFMKELWALLLSAQQNASGVPQQFLDAKEEETRKRKEESDRIVNEIQKRKEKENRELELEKSKKMDGGAESERALEQNHKPISSGSGTLSGDDREIGVRNGFRRRERNSRSPVSDHSASPHRGAASRSIGKTASKSRSFSKEGNKSNSVSLSPQLREHSSSERMLQSPRRSGISPRRSSHRESSSPRRFLSRRRSVSTPHNRSQSPSRRGVRSSARHVSPSPRSRSPTLGRRRRSRSLVRWRSPSPSKRRSRSPRRRWSRSPRRRWSRSPRRRWSRSPRRRWSRSPRRLRSPSPAWRQRRRSPSSPRYRHRFPTPVRRRAASPARRRSPSPARRRSPAPARRRSPSSSKSPSPSRQGYLSPERRSYLSPGLRRSPFHARRRSPSPAKSRPQSLAERGSASPLQHGHVSAVRHRSPSPADDSSHSPVRHKHKSPVRRRSPAQNRKRSPSPLQSQSPSPCDWSSPSSARHKSSSPVRSKSPALQKSAVKSSNGRDRNSRRMSPIPNNSQKEKIVLRENASGMLPPLQSEQTYRAKLGMKVASVSPSPDGSPAYAKSPPCIGSKSPRKDRSSHESPIKGDKSTTPPRSRIPVLKSIELKAQYESRGTTEVKHVRERSSPMNVILSGPKRSGSPERSGRGAYDKERSDNTSFVAIAAPSKSQHKGSASVERPKRLPIGDESKANRKRNSHSKDDEGRILIEKPMNSLKSNEKDQAYLPSVDLSGSEGSDKQRAGSHKQRAEVVEKRKHKRSRRKDISSDDSSSDSDLEERKEAKRRKKEEKRLRKEERRRRREERRRRREEKRANKQKRKSKESESPLSDIEKNGNDTDASHDGRVGRSKYDSSDKEETEYEKKRLEIELREKALQSLRAKKGISR